MESVSWSSPVPSDDSNRRLTKAMISQSRVIAKGRAIREVDRLVAKYGGFTSHWVKKSSPVVIIDGRTAELHWYECHGVGRVEVKAKRV